MEAIKFKIRASACHEIMAGSIGLTEIQAAKCVELSDRKNGIGKPLAANMEVELAELISKRDNPELPTGAKTYCKQWLKEYLFNRRSDISSKYIEKGNATEEAGFTLMATQLGFGMVFKNEQYRENETMTGTWDLLLERAGEVWDNKSCWSLDTFPMFEATNPKKEYDWQLAVYMELAKVEKAGLAYTLNDAPENMLQKEVQWVSDHNQRLRILNNMIFGDQAYFEAMCNKYASDATKTMKFVPIPDAQRIKAFRYAKDPTVTYRINERVRMCNQYINSLIKK